MDDWRCAECSTVNPGTRPKDRCWRCWWPDPIGTEPVPARKRKEPRRG